MVHDPKQEERRQQSEAWEWVSRVLAVCVVMVMPGIGGGWLDQRFETSWCAVAGFVFGFVSGLSALIVLVQRDGEPRHPKR